jgi:hypothetical protein
VPGVWRLPLSARGRALPHLPPHYGAVSPHLIEFRSLELFSDLLIDAIEWC